MLKVFLSASVPLPDRDSRFMETADVISIREAVKALIGEIIPSGEIVFGGHPAITPLVALLLRGLGENARKRVTLYQSAYFTEQFPQENDDFLKVTIVPNVDNSRDQSLAAMRSRMLKDTNFDVGVFIGGMEGVLDEFEAFRIAHPRASIWPVASTGAAAAEIFHCSPLPYPDIFRNQLTYQTLFRTLLQKIS